MILNWTFFVFFFNITEFFLIKWFNAIKNLSTVHSKNAGLETTQLGLFGNPALSKYWTEQLLFKKYCIAGLKWTGNYYVLLLRKNTWTKYKTNVIYLGEYSIVYNIAYI